MTHLLDQVEHERDVELIRHNIVLEKYAEIERLAREIAELQVGDPAEAPPPPPAVIEGATRDEEPPELPAGVEPADETQEPPEPETPEPEKPEPEKPTSQEPQQRRNIPRARGRANEDAILATLREGPQPQRDIAAASGVPAGSIIGVLARLERLGHVERDGESPSPSAKGKPSAIWRIKPSGGTPASPPSGQAASASSAAPRQDSAKDDARVLACIENGITDQGRIADELGMLNPDVSAAVQRLMRRGAVALPSNGKGPMYAVRSKAT